MLTETALLFFTRTAASEAANKAFVPAKYRTTNLKIASAFISNTRNLAKATNLPVYQVDEHQQVGEGFGEKLANAIEGVFEQGFQRVVVIGNDCLQLTVEVISSAVKGLDHHELVLGPDKRGGVYLVGISKKIFNRDTFAEAAWQTAELLQDLQCSFGQTVCYTLPRLNDANNYVDVIRLKNVLPLYHKLAILITSILASVYARYCSLRIHCYNTYFYLSGLRAPPSITTIHC